MEILKIFFNQNKWKQTNDKFARNFDSVISVYNQVPHARKRSIWNNNRIIGNFISWNFLLI